MPIDIHLTTFGCKLNQFETTALAQRLQEQGYTLKLANQLRPLNDDPTQEHNACSTHHLQAPSNLEHVNPPIYLLNTCAITQAAEIATKKLIRKLKSAHPQALIVLTGCYAAQLAREALQDLAPANTLALIIDNFHKEALPRYLAELLQQPPAPKVKPLIKVSQQPPATPLSNYFQPPIQSTRSRAYLKIQDGCNGHCTFCIVPRVRGRSRSLAPELIHQQLTLLATAGFKEVILTGVHIGSFGKDLQPQTSLSALLHQLLPWLAKHYPDTRLRLSSLDPHEVNTELLQCFKLYPELLCRHLHLSTQSLDPQILRLMQRSHTAKHFIYIVDWLASEIPDISLGTDIIVGFPTESQANFRTTYQLLAKLPLSYLHVFRYSERPETKALELYPKVNAQELKERSHLLLTLAKQKSLTFSKQCQGKIFKAVVHSKRHALSQKLLGLTDNYLKVLFTGDEQLFKQKVSLEIQEPAFLKADQRPSPYVLGKLHLENS